MNYLSIPVLMLLAFFADDRFYLLLALDARYHKAAPTALAAKPEVCTAAQHLHSAAATAGVFLLHNKNISHTNIHAPPPFPHKTIVRIIINISVYHISAYFATTIRLCGKNTKKFSATY